MTARRLPTLGTAQAHGLGYGARPPRIPLRLWAAVTVLCLLATTV